MAGPSGVDRPAAPVDHITDPFRVFAALMQGDHERAADLIVHMGDADLRALRPVAGALDKLTEAECEARRRAEALTEAAEWWAGANARASFRAGGQIQ